MISPENINDLLLNPGNFTDFESRDQEEAKAYATSLYCPHEFKIDPNSSKLRTRITSSLLDQIGLASVGYGANVMVEPGKLNDFYLIQTVVSGSVDITSGNQKCLSTPGMATIISPDQPTKMLWDREAHFLSIKIDRQEMEAQLSQLIARVVDVPLVFDLKMDLTTDKTKPWESAVDSLFYQLRFGSLQTEDPDSTRMFERWLISTFLHTQPHNYSGDMISGTSSKIPESIKRAICFVDTHFNEGLKNEHIANAAGISERTLTDLMKRYLGKTAKQYQQQRQLSFVRSRLRATSSIDTVTKVLSDAGIKNHGRFSGLYKNEFGELPSETRLASRARNRSR